MEKEKQEKLEYSDIIKSISYDQKEILNNIIKLHNHGEPFDCDMTYSKGMFYKSAKNDTLVIPEPKVKFDVCPLFDDVVQIEKDGKLPLEDSSISSIVVDLPFLIQPYNAPSKQPENYKKTNNLTSKRFSCYYPTSELYKSYYHWLSECYRVLKNDGIVVWKTQANVTGGKQVWSPEYSWLCAILNGFYCLDQFFVIAKNRMHSGKIKSQQHARKYTSTFYVFKKTSKPNTKLFGWTTEEEKNTIIEQLKKEAL